MIDAYVWTTPNGFKLLIALEELALPYRVNWVDIGKGEQQKPEYLKVNPNSKIPAIVDRDTNTTVFESGAVLMYLADKTKRLMPASGPEHWAALEWMYFTIGGPGPMMGQLGFFTRFAKEKIPLAIERYTKETERLMKVLDTRLGESKYLAGSEFTIADILNFTWPNAGRTFLGLDFAPFPNLVRWLDELAARPAFVKALALTP